MCYIEHQPTAPTSQERRTYITNENFTRFSEPLLILWEHQLHNDHNIENWNWNASNDAFKTLLEFL